MSAENFRPELIASFSITATGQTEQFDRNIDFGATVLKDGTAQQSWHVSGINKLIKLGLWKREFSQGKFGSPDAVLKTLPPTVEEVRAMSAPAAAAPPTPPKAAPVVPMPRAAAEAIVAAANAKMAATKTAAPAALTPDQVAAAVNGTNDAKPDAGHGWDDVIGKMNAETAKKRGQ